MEPAGHASMPPTVMHPATSHRPRIPAAVAVPVAIGLVLLAWAVVALTASHGLWLAGALGLWNAFPFGVAVLLACAAALRTAAAGFAAATLLSTLFAQYVYVIAPDDSRSVVGLFFLPFWNLLAAGPVGALVGWLLGRWSARG